MGTLRAKDTLADFTLGAMGLNCDERKATAWFLRAAKEGGDSEAQYVTALRYKLGIGYDAPNIKEAIKWFQAAVGQNHCGAPFYLGLCYDKGDGVFKNPGLALKLYRKRAHHHDAHKATRHPLLSRTPTLETATASARTGLK